MRYTIYVGRLVQWLLLLPIHLAVIIARYPLAPIAVLLFSTNDRLHLTHLRWLETIDNDLTGDSGWKNEHILPGDDPLSTWSRICWLWRNGGNAVNYGLLGCKSDSDWAQYQIAGKPFIIRPIDGYWQLFCFIPLFGKYLNLYWGWGLLGAKDGRCKYTFTTRIKNSK